MIVQGDAVRQMKSKEIDSLLAKLAQWEQIVAASPAWPFTGSVGATMMKGATNAGVLLLTTHRLMLAQKGRLGSSMAETDLQDVTDVEFDKGSFGSAARHVLIIESRSGRLMAQFAGRGADKNDGASWPRLILRTQEALTAPAKVQVVAAERTGGDLSQQLAELSRLHEAGALSDEEFRAAKLRLLE